MARILSRRTFLRDAGVVLAIPWLEAMAPSAFAAPSVGQPVRRRMICVSYSLSLHTPNLFPEEPGRNYHTATVQFAGQGSPSSRIHGIKGVRHRTEAGFLQGY